MKKINRMFRQHDVAPADVVSPLYRQLTQEWAELHATPSTPATVRKWGRGEKALAGFTLPGEIVDAIDAAGHDRTNELLLALIRLFQRGHQLAGRVVLQALLPKLAKTATHAGGMCTSSSDTWAEDRRHITLAEFWDVMADYPVDRRTSSVASNLALDTLHRVTGLIADSFGINASIVFIGLLTLASSGIIFYRMRCTEHGSVKILDRIFGKRKHVGSDCGTRLPFSAELNSSVATG